tara:strand:+ start:5496 stop:6647 length:1152 start_codon:yes stop_codon:yes gene_type:complete
LNSTLQSIPKIIDLRTFSFGVGGVVLFYLLVYSYILLKGHDTVTSITESLSTTTVIIEHEKIAQKDVITREDAQALEERHDKIAQHDDPHLQHETDGPMASDDKKSLTELLQTNTNKNLALKNAPIEGYYENSEFGLLPKRLGRLDTPFKVYKRPFLLNRDKANVAFIIADFGLSESISNTLLKELPAEVSLIMSPYTLAPDYWQKRARRSGHEIWMDVPLQTLNFPSTDPGTKGLLTSVSLGYNLERLNWILSRTTGYAGIAAYSDRAVEKSSSMFENIFDSAFKRGLGYIELNTSNQSQLIHERAKKNDAPFAHAVKSMRVFDLDTQAIKDAEAMIKERKMSVIVIKPTSKNIMALSNWITRLKESNVGVAPASAIAAIKE